MFPTYTHTVAWYYTQNHFSFVVPTGYQLLGVKTFQYHGWGFWNYISFYAGHAISLASIKGGSKTILTDTTTGDFALVIPTSILAATFTLSVVPNSTLITFNPGGPSILAQPTTNLALAMAYQIFFYAKSGANVIASTTATFTYVNPCFSTTLSWVTAPVAITYSVLTTAQTQTVSVHDQVSVTCAVANSCGLYTYTISDVPASGVTALTTVELTISSSGVISVATTNAATVGAHTVTVVARLASYTAVTISTPVSLTVTACLVTGVQVVQ
jgi:hypothetical protein